MDNQHRKISGYRELDQVEIDLMNAVKLLGRAQEEMLLQVQEYIKAQRAAVSADAITEEQGLVIQRMDNATPERFAAMAKTEFQTGLMYLTRAVAQPEFF